MERDASLFRRAARQHGLVTRDEARELGLTERMIRYRLASGMLDVVSPGVYRVGGAPVTWHQRLLGACLGGGATGVASHRSAAALHRFDGFRPGILEVTVRRGRNYQLAGVRVHTSVDLGWSEVERCVVEGIPCTTPLRTLIDLGAVVPRHRVEECFDSAERDGLVDPDEVRHLRTFLGCSGRDGLGAIADVLDGRAGRQPTTVLERKMLRLLKKRDLPRPECQYRVVRPDGQLADIDFAYPRQRIAIEVDGHAGHATRRQRQNDAWRETQVSLDGWTPLRFTWEDVTRRPEYVADTVRAALAASRAST